MRLPGDYFHIKELNQIENDFYRYMNQKIQDIKSKLNKCQAKSVVSDESNSYIETYLIEAKELDKKFGKDPHLFHGRVSSGCCCFQRGGHA